MKFVVRSIKYLAYFVLVFFIIVGIIYIFSYQKEQGLTFVDLFEEGSLPKLVAFFLVFAIVYPFIGFRKMKLYLNGPFSKYSSLIKSVMDTMGYQVETDLPGLLTFRLKKASQRFSRLYEDRISFDLSDDVVVMEGYTKDISRIKSNIEFTIKQQEGNQE